MDENRVDNTEVADAAVAVEVEPVAVEVEPVAVEVEPVAVEVEPVAAEVEPVAVEVEPVAAEVEPATDAPTEEPVLEVEPVEEPTVLTDAPEERTEEEIELARQRLREEEADEKAKKAKRAQFWDSVGNIILVILMISPILILSYIFLWFAFPEFFTYGH